MALIIDTNEYLDTAVALLKDGKSDVPVPIAGNSMIPFLREGDTVYLSPIVSEVKKGDVLLYTRKDGSYVLHRAAGKEKNGIIMMLGDNQVSLEPVPVSKLLAEAKTAMRKGKLVTKKSPVWSFYRRVWLSIVPLRPYISRILK